MENFTPEQLESAKNFSQKQRDLYNRARAAGSTPEVAFNSALLLGGEKPDLNLMQKVGKVSEAIAEEIGGKELAQGFGQVFASGKTFDQQDEVVERANATTTALIERLREAREAGDTERVERLTRALGNVDFGEGMDQEFVTNKEVVGSSIKLATTAASAFAGDRLARGLIAGGARPLQVGLRAGAVEGGLYGVGRGTGNALADEKGVGGIATQALQDGLLFGGMGALGGGAIGGALQGYPVIAGRIATTADNVNTGVTQKVDSLKDLFNRQKLTGNRTADGISQVFDDLRLNADRAKQRVVEGIDDLADKRAQIQASTPAKANAIQVGVNENLLLKLDNLVDETGAVDRATLDTLRDINKLAQDPNRGATNVLERLGDEAENAFGFIDAERRRVGEELGEQIKTITGNKPVNMKPAYDQLDMILGENGINVQTVDGVTEISFGGGKTPQERNKIIELYEEATRLGDSVTPVDIHRQDQAFASMKREARYDGLTDLLVDLPDGSKKSLFDVMRDVFRETLDDVNPEIRKLNAEYAPLRILQDDLDDTIFRSFGNIDSLKNVTSRGDYTPNAFRRMFSNADSATNYRELVRLLETKARELGYKGANLERAADLAIDIQRLYPEGIQKASLEGIFGSVERPDMSLGNVLGRTLGLGRPNLRDQQKAITALLEELAKTAQ